MEVGIAATWPLPRNVCVPLSCSKSAVDFRTVDSCHDRWDMPIGGLARAFVRTTPCDPIERPARGGPRGPMVRHSRNCKITVNRTGEEQERGKG